MDHWGDRVLCFVLCDRLGIFVGALVYEYFRLFVHAVIIGSGILGSIFYCTAKFHAMAGAPFLRDLSVAYLGHFFLCARFKDIASNIGGPRYVGRLHWGRGDQHNDH